MTINEALVDLINTTQNKYFLYISADDKSLTAAFNHLLINVDLAKTTSRVVFVHPTAVHKVAQTIHGVFADRGTPLFSQPPKLTLDAAFAWVDPETKEVSA